MSFELDEEYKLRPEVLIPPHDISKGLKRHMPIEYDRTGRYRQKRHGFPLWQIAAVAGGVYGVLAAIQ